MKYYCNPLNLEYRFQFCDNNNPTQGEKKYKGHREAADPSLILFKGKYYLFPSMTAGFFTSEDLAEWEFHKFRSDMPIYDYAPDVRGIGDYLYFCASKRSSNCSFYRTKDPVNEPFEEIEGTFSFWDPDMFLDDDGRLYFYWGCSNVTPIYGVELDRETMKPLGEPQVMFDSDTAHRGYERFGEEHVPPKTIEQMKAQAKQMAGHIPGLPDEVRQKINDFLDETPWPSDPAGMRALAEELGGMVPGIPVDMLRLMFGSVSNAPYIEGAWMNKYQGRYYLQYAIPGTQYNVYGDGVYVSDSPLGPYVPAKNNPYSYKPGGFITGAGHGSTLEDKEGNYWHTSTMRISHTHSFERRLGLWKAGFDADGELFCDQRYGDWPMTVEGAPWQKPEWMLLSYGKKVTASSGEGAQNATDENIRTWWKAGSAGPGEWLQVDLGEVKDVRAVQINFAEDGLLMPLPQGADLKGETYEKRFIDEVVQPTRWILESSQDGEHYTVVEDKSQVTTDYSHDFLVREEGIQARFLRLTILELPYGQTPCISGLRIFGRGNGELPAAAADVKAQLSGDLDMNVSWSADNAVGANILWGHAPDKLYHSYMVFGRCEQRVGALVKGEPVYIRVDTFNETGITEGEVQKVRD